MAADSTCMFNALAELRRLVHDWMALLHQRFLQPTCKKFTVHIALHHFLSHFYHTHCSQTLLGLSVDDMVFIIYTPSVG